MKSGKKWIIAGLVFIVLAGSLLALPPIRERVSNRLDLLRIRVFYLINPPEDSVFNPSESTPDPEVARIVAATLTHLAPPTGSPTPLPPTQTPLPPEAPTPTLTPSPTPLPAALTIDNMPYVDQHYGFNECAPANLSMVMHFWGWSGDPAEVSSLLKPYSRDKNVMPYEMVDYVNGQTGLRALERFGGDLDLLKRLAASGFPVIVERGVNTRDMTGKISWMGHYQVVYGYDDAQSLFQVKDSLEPGGDRYTVAYDDLRAGWRSFNYAFVVVYPPEQEDAVMLALGDHAGSNRADQIAAQAASDEIYQTEGQDRFFAMFNRASSLVRLQDYGGAAAMYDEAFAFYAGLSPEERPWRMLWYQTGPYYAYYYTGRYYDVISLADKTIEGASEPYIEESFYWRARAKAALGDSAGAIADLEQSLKYHPDFGPSAAFLREMGE